MSGSVRDKVIDLVALMYLRVTHEDDVYDEMWDLSQLAGWDDPDEPMDHDQLRAWLAANL